MIINVKENQLYCRFLRITPTKKLEELQNILRKSFSRTFGVGNSSFACPMNFEALPELWPPHVINTKEVPSTKNDHKWLLHLLFQSVDATIRTYRVL